MININMESSNKNVRNWSYQEGRALIMIYENRKDEYFKCRKKKDFWESILTDLEATNILVGYRTKQLLQSRTLHLFY